MILNRLRHLGRQGVVCGVLQHHPKEGERRRQRHAGIKPFYPRCQPQLLQPCQRGEIRAQRDASVPVHAQAAQPHHPRNHGDGHGEMLKGQLLQGRSTG
jgi:hypothetical protein